MVPPPNLYEARSSRIRNSPKRERNETRAYKAAITQDFKNLRNRSNDPNNLSNSNTNGPSNSNGNSPKFPCCTIRDNDPRVHYDGVWTLNGTQISTTHTTTLSGSTISLNFFGVGIAVFGVVPASNDTFKPPTAVYVLDDQPFPVTLPFAAVDIPNQPLFATNSPLTQGRHVLVINVTDASTPFSIQRFFVPTDFPTAKDMIGQLPSGATLVPTSPVATATTGSHNGPTPSSSQVNSPIVSTQTASNPQKTIRILANLLGTLIFLVVVGIVILVLFRRRIFSARSESELGESKAECTTECTSRRETMYSTWLTSTESIMRHDTSIFRSPPRTPHSIYSRRSEARSGRSASVGRTSTIEGLAPPPLPPKTSIFAPPPLPPKPILIVAS